MGETQLNVEINLDDFLVNKDDIMILSGFQTYVDNKRTSYLIINWQENIIYSFIGVKKSLDSTDDNNNNIEIANYKNTYSFSELMGIGLKYGYENSDNTSSNYNYFKETSSNLDKGKQWQESKKNHEIEYQENFPYGYDISTENLAYIVLYLRFDKNTHRSSPCDEILYIFDNRYSVDDSSENIIHYLNLSEKYENALKNVIYKASGLPHKKELNNLDNDIFTYKTLSTTQKLSNLLKYYLNDEINIEEFIRRKNSILKNITEWIITDSIIYNSLSGF